jgi:tetratricopeptide (TPR) repeat protein
VGETPLEGLSQGELEQRLAHALAVGDEAAAGEIEVQLAQCLLDAGELESARRHGERAVALQRRGGEGGRRAAPGLGRALAVFGHAARALGDTETATGAYLEAIDHEGRHGHRDSVAELLSTLGGMAATVGDRERARDLLAAALRTAPEAREDAARRAELGLARMELEDGDDGSAARRALRVVQGGATGGVALDAALLLRDAGAHALAEGDSETARRRHEFALAVLRRNECEVEVLVDLVAALAAACRAAGDHGAARAHAEEAVSRTADMADGAAAVELRAALLLATGEMCLLEEGDPAAALGYLEDALVASETAGTLPRSAAVVGRLHEAARAAGDAAAAERWRVRVGRAAFAANVGRLAEALLAEAPRPPMATAVLGDTGRQPRILRIPGGRVSDGVLWRRRLLAEVRRAAPLGRVAVLRGGLQAQLTPGVRPVDAPLTESVWMFLVERDSVEVRMARVSREGGVARCPSWALAEEPGWPGSRDGLVEALRAALG